MQNVKHFSFDSEQ